MKPKLRQYHIRLTPDIAAFLDRKKELLKKNSQLAGNESSVTYSNIVQSILAFWRAMDSEEAEDASK